MASKVALAVFVLLLVSGQLGHGVPLRRELGFEMDSVKGGSPGGMQTSETTLDTTAGKKWSSLGTTLYCYFPFQKQLTCYVFLQFLASFTVQKIY